MGSIYVELLNQLTTTSTETNEDSSQLVCECSRGELRYDTLSSQNYISLNNCNIRGICAYVAKSKHKAKICSKEYQNTVEFEQQQEKNSKLFQSKTEKVNRSPKPKHKSLLLFVD